MYLRIIILLCISTFSQWSLARNYEFTYEVTITNLTRGQTFTPQLLVTHNRRVQLFEAGQPASNELAILAEAGDTQPFTTLLESQNYRVGEVKTVAGLLGPGETVVSTITANPYYQPFLSMAAMLIPTNDTFVAADSIRLPRRYRPATETLIAYDAGTEFNDQKCINIPGPRCGGQGTSADQDTDEGYVYVSNGFHELGTEDAAGNEILTPAVYDWRNPVAKITIELVRR